MRYKKQANNGLGFKKDLDESLKTLKAHGYILTQNQENYILTSSGCKVVISDPVKKRRASGVISQLIPTKLSHSGKQRYTIAFSCLNEIPFVSEDFSKHRKGVKVHNQNGIEIK